MCYFGISMISVHVQPRHWGVETQGTPGLSALVLYTSFWLASAVALCVCVCVCIYRSNWWNGWFESSRFECLCSCGPSGRVVLLDKRLLYVFCFFIAVVFSYWCGNVFITTWRCFHAISGHFFLCHQMKLFLGCHLINTEQLYRGVTWCLIQNSCTEVSPDV